MERSNFYNQTAVITGSGQGLGKAYAVYLASRGARIVVNDIGIDDDGIPLAKKVANEIKKLGGKAIANYNSVSEKSGVINLVDEAIEAYGSIDIFIHNAGIMKEDKLCKMSEDNWKAVIDIHLNSAFHILQKIIPIMREKRYGRVVMITSSVGMFGMKNQSNYAAAKMGLLGLVKSVTLEMEDIDFCCNLVSPLAVTRHTSYAINKEMQHLFTPELVAPIVAFLSSKECKKKGEIYVAGGGYFSRIGFYEGEGIKLKTEELDVDIIAKKIDEISDMDESKHISSITQAAKKLLKKVLRG